MSSRRPAPLSSLALVLPRPQLPRRPSSIRSSTEIPCPQTPRTSLGLPSPNLLKLDSAQPRRSTDSWNSSVCEGGDDDMDWEWVPEQLKLLNKALDGLPSHILSPYNGVIPPINILDKIARSIIHAKDPLEWPHSIRATRIMLLKLARGRAAECARNELSGDVLQNTANIPKKPLYRQSSMDFLKGKSLKDDTNVDRLSTRLQRVDRIIPNPTYAYDRCSSRTPPSTPGRRALGLTDMPSTPRTPGSEEGPFRGPPPSLSSSRGSKLRRTTTTLSGLPTIPAGVASNCVTPEKACIDLPTRKVRRSESFTSHLNGLGHSLKRAPSYGSVSARSIDSRMSIDDEKENSPFLAHPSDENKIDIYPSSDEEEKKRLRIVKKHKSNLADRQHDQSGVTKPKAASVTKAASSATLKANAAAKGSSKPTTRARKISAKKISVTPCSFGAPLPNPQPEPPVPIPRLSGALSPQQCENLSFNLPPSGIELDMDSFMDAEVGPSSPITPQKRLRRVKTANFPQRIKRRISFAHLSAPNEGDEGDQANAHSGAGLESAFQLS